MTIYFVAGEASGDNHGAALMSSLRKHDVDLRFTGRGGPHMKAIAGEGFDNWLDEAAVLGLWEVIRKYGYFRKQFRQTLREIANTKPDAVVMIDYPGFNLRLARALRNTGLKPVRPAEFYSAEAGLSSQSRVGRTGQSPVFRLIYYISPQVWAWNRGRIQKMARYLDLMLCIFPFEAELYNKSGLRTEFVGHPMIDRLRTQKIDVERDSNLIGLFPGSRRREIRKIFPIMLKTAAKLRRSKPNLQFEVAAASQELAREMTQGVTAAMPWMKITVGQTAAIMQRAFAGIVASGSATLEAAYFRLPFVLVYKVAWPTYLAAQIVVHLAHIGMPNVLAGREIVPEFIQHRARPSAIANAVLRLIDDTTAHEKMISELDAIIRTLGEGGASEIAARAIVAEIACHSEPSKV